MRMIVEAFAESLELGLAKYDQIVVRTCILSPLSPFVSLLYFLVVPE